MKILDERGRLFGRINIVDLLIVVLILIIIPAFLQVYNILSKRPTRVPVKWIKIEAVAFILPSYLELIKEGDISYDENRNAQGRVVKIVKKDIGYSERLKSYMLDIQNDAIYPYKIPIFLELELACTKSGKAEPWYYRKFLLVVSMSSTFDFITDMYAITCYTLKTEEPRDRN